MIPARTYHHGDLRRALVDEAYEEVREHGAADLSLRAVAARVGVSPSAAYHHFSDKDALLIEAGERANETFNVRMRAAAAAVPGDTDLQACHRFLALARAYVHFALEEPHLFRHNFGELCARHAGPPAPGGGDGAFGLLLAALDQLDSRGVISASREHLELVLWSAVHGFAELALVGWMPPAAEDQFLDALARLTLDPQTYTRLVGRRR